jgi:ATP-dependent Clp protease adapter protein ClpS
MRCGGSYLHWAREVNGKAVTKTLTPEQLARYQAWLNNAARQSTWYRTKFSDSV